MKDLEQIILDANDNFDNGRFKDAYSHYHSISEKLLDTGEIDQSIYYGYRAVQCLMIGKNTYEIWKEIGIMGLNYLKLSLKNLGKELTLQKDPREIKKTLMLQLNLIENSDFTHYNQKIRSLLINNIKRILEEPNLETQTKIDLLEEVMSYQGDQEDDRFGDFKEDLVKNLLLQADTMQDDEINIYSKIQTYQQILPYATNSRTIAEVKAKIEVLQKIVQNY